MICSLLVYIIYIYIYIYMYVCIYIYVHNIICITYASIAANVIGVFLSSLLQRTGKKHGSIADNRKYQLY